MTNKIKSLTILLIIIDIVVFVVSMSLTLCGYEEAFLVGFPLMIVFSFIGMLIRTGASYGKDK